MISSILFTLFCLIVVCGVYSILDSLNPSSLGKFLFKVISSICILMCLVWTILSFILFRPGSGYGVYPDKKPQYEKVEEPLYRLKTDSL